MIISQNRGRAIARTSADAGAIHHEIAPGASSDFGEWLSWLYIDEVNLARQRSTNVLLIGAGVRCDDVIAMLGPGLAEPIATWCMPEALALPHPRTVATLILRGIEALGQEDQRRLLDWTADAIGVKVVSTATAPLLTCVNRGTFLDVLYYRLNTICVFMDPSEAATARNI